MVWARPQPAPLISNTAANKVNIPARVIEWSCLGITKSSCIYIKKKLLHHLFSLQNYKIYKTAIITEKKRVTFLFSIYCGSRLLVTLHSEHLEFTRICNTPNSLNSNKYKSNRQYLTRLCFKLKLLNDTVLNNGSVCPKDPKEHTFLTSSLTQENI